jgi:TRAP-type mannitol/chloroaromatic compound transport system substrate-binding protein
MTSLFINKAKWNELPPLRRQLVEVAAYEANTLTLARCDALNPAALRRLVGAGTQLRHISAEILDVAHRATTALFAELAGGTPCSSGSTST